MEQFRSTYIRDGLPQVFRDRDGTLSLSSSLISGTSSFNETYLKSVAKPKSKFAMSGSGESSQAKPAAVEGDPYRLPTNGP